MAGGLNKGEIQMNQEQFKQLLSQEGFQDIVVVERAAHGFLDIHTHPFEAKALIVEGEIFIQSDNSARTYVVGDIFHLAEAEPHTERYGPVGVKYLAGRKTAV